MGSPANGGPWLFSNKEQQNIKAFFNQPMKLTLSVMMFFSEEVPEAAFILYNEMLAPYLPEKSPKLVSRLLMWISLQKL